MLRFSASLPYDRRLAGADIKGSLAHVKMLAVRGIIDAGEAEAITTGLQGIEIELEEGCFPFDIEFEDIHMNIEKRLIEKIGPVGGKMHTARSRNDQVALDLHLYLKEEIATLDQKLHALQETVVDLAERHENVLIPGYTHLQRAQPVLLAHHLLAYFWMFKRDRERLAGCLVRADLMPLGSGALAGTGFDIDRRQVAESLGFKALYENSIDAVSDRDYIVEFISFAAILIMHLSRLCEELVIWSTTEFSFIELDDAYTTGSSMMPQKKNPDLAELIRGKSGRIYGSLMAVLAMMKGLPLAYNKDMQEDKEGLFDTIDTLQEMLPLLSAMLRTMKVNRERLEDAVDDDELCATDLADYLVTRAVPFREAHHAVGEMIACSRREGVRIKDMPPDQRGRFHRELAGEIDSLLDPRGVVAARRSRGGTAPEALRVQLQLARELL